MFTERHKGPEKNVTIFAKIILFYHEKIQLIKTSKNQCEPQLLCMFTSILCMFIHGDDVTLVETVSNHSKLPNFITSQKL